MVIINLLLEELIFLRDLVWLFIIFIGLPALIAIIPLALFWMTFKVFNLIRRNKPLLAVLVAASIITILGIVGGFYKEIGYFLMASTVLIFPWAIFLFYSVMILLLLVIYLVNDLFFKKKLSIAKRVAIGILIMIYILPIFHFIYVLRMFLNQVSWGIPL